MAERTKFLLAEELKRRSKMSPLSRIKVSELCEACGVDRRTFYYHFKDVYDLTAWIYNQTVDELLPGKDGNPGIQGYEKALGRLQKDNYFYRRALDEDSQNSLGRHILLHNFMIYAEAVKSHSGGDSLSEKDEFEIRYHCYGSLGMIRRWLFTGCTPPPKKMAALLVASMPPVLQQLYSVPEDLQELSHCF